MNKEFNEFCDEDFLEIQAVITQIMSSATSSEYSKCILEKVNEKSGNTLMEDVIQNVLETSAWNEDGYYTDDDVCLAIGRVLMERLGIEN